MSYLHPFMLTHAISWLSLTAVVVQYALAVREAEKRNSATNSSTLGDQPKAGSPRGGDELPTGGNGPSTGSITGPGVPPHDGGNGPTSGGDRSPSGLAPDLTPPPPPDPRYPDQVAWSKGSHLVLVAMTPDAVGQHAALYDEITKIQKDHKSVLIGGGVFLVGPSRVGRATDLLAPDAMKNVFGSNLAGLEGMIGAIRQDQEYVAKQNMADFPTIVIWRSGLCPVPRRGFSLGRLKNAHLVWTGMNDDQQRQPEFEFLDRIFGEKRVQLCGDLEFAQVSIGVSRLIGRQAPQPPAE